MFPVVWAGLGLVAALKLNMAWLVLVVIVASLTGANLVGYVQCDKDARRKLASSLGSSLMTGFIGNKINAMLS